MKIHLPGFLSGRKNKKPPAADPIQLISSLGDTVPRGKTRLRIPVPAEFYADLYKFLDQMGFVSVKRDKEGIALLLEYGLADPDRETLEKNRRDTWDDDYIEELYQRYVFCK